MVQKIRVKGSQLHEAQLKFDFLSKENVNLINNIHEAERLLGITKEKFFGMDQGLNGELSALRTEKFHTNSRFQVVMEKITQKQQR